MMLLIHTYINDLVLISRNNGEYDSKDLTISLLTDKIKRNL